MSVYLEVSVIATFILLFGITTILKPSKELNKNVVHCMLCFLCSSLAVFANFAIVWILGYFLYIFRTNFKELIGSFLIYCILIQIVTLLVPSQIQEGIIYFPISFSLEICLFCLICMCFEWLYLYVYNPILYQFQFVTVLLDEFVICGLGYLDSGNTAFINGKPVVFIKKNNELFKLFKSEQKDYIQSIHGYEMCEYKECVIRRKGNEDVRAILVFSEFEGNHDFILNLYI